MNASDIISRIGSGLVNWVDGWDPSGMQFLVRAVLLYGLPLALCVFAFYQGNRSVGLQGICLIVGVLLALTIPLHWIRFTNPTMKLWAAAIFAVLLGFLPGILPAYITPTVGAQARTVAISYLILVVLFLLNLTFC